jgi:hypothetical protein
VRRMEVKVEEREGGEGEVCSREGVSGREKASVWKADEETGKTAKGK